LSDWKKLGIVIWAFLGFIFVVVWRVDDSYIFTILRQLVPPLQSMSHYSGLLLGGGAYVLVIAGAGYGFEVFVKNPKRWSSCLGHLVLFSTAGYMALGWYIYPDGLNTSASAIVSGLSIAFVATLYLVRKPVSFSKVIFAAYFLCLFSFFDLTWAAHYYATGFPLLHAGPSDGSSIDKLGKYDLSLENRSAKAYINGYHFLESTGLKTLRELGMVAEKVPAAKIFNKIVIRKTLERSDLAAAFGDDAANRRLAVSPTSRHSLLRSETTLTAAHGGTQQSARAETSAPSHTLKLLHHTYNTQAWQVNSNESGFLFLSTTHSPFWTATVNGKPVQVHRALGYFLALPIDSGVSRLQLTYQPNFIAASLFIAYFLIGLILLLTIPKIHNFFTRGNLSLRKRYPTDGEKTV